MSDRKIVPFPTIESVAITLNNFATENGIKPADLMDIFQAGIFAHRGFLIDAEDRHPEMVEASFIVRKGYAPESAAA